MKYHIGFQLREVASAIEKYFQNSTDNEALEHLKGPQGAVLFFLNKHQTKQIVQKDIEEFLKIKKAAASSLIKRMEKNGFISVETSLEDKRYKVIHSTEKGRKNYQQIVAFLTKMEEDLTQDISDDELEQLERVLIKIMNNTKISKMEEFKC